MPSSGSSNPARSGLSSTRPTRSARQRAPSRTCWNITPAARSPLRHSERHGVPANRSVAAGYRMTPGSMRESGSANRRSRGCLTGMAQPTDPGSGYPRPPATGCRPCTPAPRSATASPSAATPWPDTHRARSSSAGVRGRQPRRGARAARRGRGLPMPAAPAGSSAGSGRAFVSLPGSGRRRG